jgi:hypothetical protein
LPKVAKARLVASVSAVLSELPIMVLEKLGAEIEIERGYVIARLC